MSNGTSGDINNIKFVNSFPQPRQPRKKPFEQIRYVAGSVADEVFRVYSGTKHGESITLAMTERELTLDVRKPTAEQLQRAEKVLAEPDESKLPSYAKVYAEYALELAEMPPTDDIILQAIRIGDVGITSIPCEVFAEIGLDIKKRSPLKPSFTIELANGWNRYLPTPRQHRLGGYETWLGTAILEIQASEKIEHVLLDLLRDVSREEATRKRSSNE